jgi:hypothetical protein
MMLRSPLLLASLSLAALSASGCPVNPPALPENHFPVARLVLPQLAAVGEAVDVDASGSDDEDGGALSFVFAFGDGSPEAEAKDPVFGHVFAGPGTFEVGVRVVDDRGFETAVSLAVVVVEGAAEGCGCDLPCFDGAACTARGCLLQASSIEDDEVGFDDAVACD